MNVGSEWQKTIRQAAERLRTRYEHIGRTSGAPFLGVVYPPEAEPAVLKEWAAQADALRPEIEVLTIDALEITSAAMDEPGAAEIVRDLRDPHPGSDPLNELGEDWADAIVRRGRTLLDAHRAGPPGGRARPVLAVQRLAALYPASGPENVMRRWEEPFPDAPVVMLIPGQIGKAKAYHFLGRREELMYRGDLV